MKSGVMIRSGASRVIFPDSGPLEIARNGTVLTLTFNASGGFTLMHNGQTIVPTLQPGNVMPDGTFYGGISPHTGGRRFYVAAQHAPLLMSWRDAQQYAEASDAHGHKDWRLPTRDELDVLFNNRAIIGGFDTSGSFPASHYWSSTEYVGDFAWFQRFSDGYQRSYVKDNVLSVRCVRS